MHIIQSSAAAEHEIKKSKFLSFIVPIETFEAKERELRAAHPKARHFVTASRQVNAFDQVVESFSDDGEPKGVAGMPTLKVLQGADIVNAAVITVRYFGGIKLGTGGMARAYADAANLAVANAVLNEYIKPYTEQIELTYSELSRLEYLAGEAEAVALADKRFLTGGVSVRLEGRESDVKRVIARLRGT